VRGWVENPGGLDSQPCPSKNQAGWFFSLVDVPERAGEEVREALAQAVAPVLPVVAVAALAEAHLHAGLLQERVHRAVVVDHRLVLAAAHVDALARTAGVVAELVDEAHDLVEERAAVVLADVGEDEGAGLQE